MTYKTSEYFEQYCPSLKHLWTQYLEHDPVMSATLLALKVIQKKEKTLVLKWMMLVLRTAIKFFLHVMRMKLKYIIVLMVAEKTM